MSLKQKLKIIYSFIRNPKLRNFNKNIGKNVYIGKHSFVNKRKFLFVSDRVRIGDNFEVKFYPSFANEKYLCNVTIEEDCYLCDNVRILCNDSITIRKNVLMASNILITSENHGTNPEIGIPYGEQKLTHNAVEIGENCWIGERVIILPGVTIGEWSIIAAGAVVNKSVPPYEMWGGVPAAPIKRYNFNTKTWERIK